MPPNNQFPFQNTETATPAAPTNLPVQPAMNVVTAPSTQDFIPKTTDNKTTIPAPKNPNSTQNSLLLSEVRDNMVIMADGSFRAVIACQSINFDLMSSREREGVEYSYQNFLNSLNYPIQILIKSDRVDIGPYLDKLTDLRRSQDNMLLGVLMDDYINFIDSLAQEANIMDKKFFITVPYYQDGNVGNVIEQSKGLFSSIFAKQKNVITKIDTATYEKAKTEIKNRVDNVTSGLFQVGVQSVQLSTKELGELYYNAYNPDTAVRQPLGNFNDMAATYVKKADNPGGTQ